jgi:glycerate 2-kinase
MGEVIVAPDKFDGAIDAARATQALVRGRCHQLDPAVPGAPRADGGEDTPDAKLAAGSSQLAAAATAPVGEPVQTRYVHRSGVAVAELADVCEPGHLAHGGPTPSAVRAVVDVRGG